MENVIRRQENPLGNPLIIFEIFKYLRLFDLKNCRLVCELWHQESHTWLKKCARIYLQSPEVVQEFGNTPHYHRFSSYHLNLPNLLQHRITRELRTFLDPHIITELTLSISLLSKIIMVFISTCTNLETLIFSVPTYDTSGFMNYSDPNVIFNFPKLKKFICKYVRRGTFHRFEPLLNASPILCEIRTNDSNLTQILLPRLEIWTETLEKLEIGSVTRSSETFPLLKNLKELAVLGENFTFPGPSSLPMLESATVEHPMMSTLLPESIRGSTIKSLHLRHPTWRDWSGFTAVMFPHLKILSFPWITAKLFQSICKNIKTLQEITVKTIDDNMVIGFPYYRNPQKLKEIIELAKFPRFRVHQYRKYAFVGDLPMNLIDLTSVEMNGLTEASIFFGFAHCESLVSLKLGIDVEDVSKETICEMGKKMTNLQRVLIESGLDVLHMERRNQVLQLGFSTKNCHNIVLRFTHASFRKLLFHYIMLLFGN